MGNIQFKDRAAVQIENEHIRLTVMKEGGHIAEILHKATGVNPLWIPPWKSIEPSTYDPDQHPEYGLNAESKLLAGIMGHNLCLDVFGPPSAEEVEAGMTVHGEASVARYEFETGDAHINAHATLPLSQLGVSRSIRLNGDGSSIDITESVENLTGLDRPIAWTQHVTLGPPFLVKGVTQFRAPGTKSKVYDAEFGDTFKQGAEFEWPMAPRVDGSKQDLRVYTGRASSSGYTTHLMDPHRDDAFFLAFSPQTKVLFGYKWPRKDFPWLGLWEENQARMQTPWNGKTITQGFEFGASPMPEARRKMIERGSLFGVPGYRWIPAKGRLSVQYSAFITTADAIPEEI